MTDIEQLLQRLDPTSAEQESHRLAARGRVLARYNAPPAAAPELPASDWSLWRFVMKHPTLGLSAASLLLLCGVAALWSVLGGPAAPAYAQLVEPLLKAKSGRFVTRVIVDGKEVARSQCYFKGAKTVIIGKRSEPDSVNVQDGEAGRVLEISHAKKHAVLYDIPEGTKGEKEILAKYGGGLLGSLRYQLDPAIELPKGPNGQTATREEIEEKLPGGRKRHGIRLTGRDADGKEMARMTVWADPRTGEPTEAEMWFGFKPKNKTVLSDFDFNFEPDDALFSTTPPEGYTLDDRTK